jgi:hypothetical protein
LNYYLFNSNIDQRFCYLQLKLSLVKGEKKLVLRKRYHFDYFHFFLKVKIVCWCISDKICFWKIKTILKNIKTKQSLL